MSIQWGAGALLCLGIGAVAVIVVLCAIALSGRISEAEHDRQDRDDRV